MKKIILLVAIAVSALTLTTYAGSGSRQIKKDLKVALMPSSLNLVEKNGVVDVKFKISVPREFVHSKHQYIFTPVLTDFNNVMPLTSVVINGEKYAKMAASNGHSKEMKEKMKSAPDMSNAVTLNATKNPRVIEYEYTIPYQPWMQNANLICIQRFNSKKSTVLISEDIYSKGVTVTPIPIPVQEIATSVVETIKVMDGKVNINFPINSSKIDMTLDSNIRELLNLENLITGVMENPNAIVDSVVIVASSSPDGIWESNNKLAMARAKAVKHYLVSNLGVAKDMTNMISVRCIAENWEGLENLVNASNVTGKPQILKVLAIKDLTARERAMMALPQYGYMKKYILPQLRFVKYKICYRTVTTETTVLVAPIPETPAVAPQQQQMAQPMQMMPMRGGAMDNLKMKDKDKRDGKNKAKIKFSESPHYLRYHR